MPSTTVLDRRETGTQATPAMAHIEILSEDGERVIKDLHLPVVGMTLAEMINEAQRVSEIALHHDRVIVGDETISGRALQTRTVEEGKTYGCPDP